MALSFVEKAVHCFSDNHAELDVIEWIKLFIFLAAGMIAAHVAWYNQYETIFKNTIEDMDENPAGNT